MILDIGGRCSTLIFLDGSRFFVRTIPIAGDTITQQIAKEFNISYADAEEMKRKHGYVSLGGAYEESDSEVASAVSKIVRNVMTRLHGEINRSINVYRATQKGRKPEKLFLAGGTSILPYTPRFFSEKLRIPVEYLNPFQVANVGPAVDQQVLSEVAHLYAETIGLALRRLGTSPVEISLIPDYIRKQNEFRSKRPFFLASAVVLLLYLVITLWAYSQQAENIESKSKQFSTHVSQREAIQKRVKDAGSKLAVANGQFDEAVELLKSRNNLIAFYSLIKSCIPDNVWLSDFSISNSPTVKSALDSAETTDKSKKGKQPADTSEDDDDQKQSDASSSGLTWVNMEAYVICEKSDTWLNDRSAAINNITSKMKENGKIFKAKDEEIIIVYDDGRAIDHLTICKFLLAVELTEPIDSPELEKLLAQKYSPVSPEGDDGEEEKE